MRTLLALLVALLTAVTLAPPAALAQDGDDDRTTQPEGGGDRLTGAPFATRSSVVAPNGIAATSQPLASQIAVDVLKGGGNAVDAAIAANAALGLMEPTGNGIGGDLFAMVWDPEAGGGSGKLYGLNASGRAPRNLTLDELNTELGEREEIPLIGTAPVTVPGTVSGWYKLHGRFGQQAMSENLAPAIRYARDGFPLSQVIAYYWKGNTDAFKYYQRETDLLPEQGNWRETYLVRDEEGDTLRAPRQGEMFTNPDLANTLETIAENGRSAFYEGEIARTIDAYMREIGGHLRYEDLAEHEATWVEPVSTEYRGYEVYELPPNGQGIAALQMLQLLKEYDLEGMGHNTADYLHVMAEAKKLAFEDRARFYADPAFYDVPTAKLLSEEYADARREQIAMDDVMQTPTHGNPERFAEATEMLQEGDTIYLTVADSTGMMVSLIQSNYAGMGSGLVPPELGFMLQDRGALFNLNPDHPNAYAPEKRPFHTIIPAFVTKDGRPWMSFGVMGGAMQPQGHVQILANMIDFGMNVQEAGDAARYRHRGSSSPTGSGIEGGGTLNVESGVPAPVVEALREMGHAVEVDAGGYGGYQAIRWDPEEGVYWGATEMRKDGEVVGY
jgi:gamma-glutamyltranspeptidase/glutathione hydrolase